MPLSAYGGFLMLAGTGSLGAILRGTSSGFLFLRCQQQQRVIQCMQQFRGEVMGATLRGTSSNRSFP